MNDFERRSARMHADFDRFHRKTMRFIYVGWAVSLGVLGVVVWAVIRLVAHFTS